MTRVRAAAVVAVAAVAGVWAAPAARAGKGAKGASIAFARGTALWRVPASGGKPARIAKLGAKASRVRRISASRSGRRILVELENRSVVVTIRPGESAATRTLPCRGRSALAPGGRAVLCRHKGRTVKVALASRSTSVRDLGGRAAGFLGPDTTTAVAANDGGLWAVSLASGTRRRLAPHTPGEHILVAPDGKRAVATYDEDERSVLYSFQLDGRGARRKLVAGGVPVAWSWDSEWVAVQNGRRACLIRAVGGEYKCWRRYRAVAIAADGRRAILARRHKRRWAIYTAPLAGARARRPHRLVRGASAGAAAWLSAAPDVEDDDAR